MLPTTFAVVVKVFEIIVFAKRTFAKSTLVTLNGVVCVITTEFPCISKFDTIVFTAVILPAKKFAILLVFDVNSVVFDVLYIVIFPAITLEVNNPDVIFPVMVNPPVVITFEVVVETFALPVISVLMLDVTHAFITFDATKFATTFAVFNVPIVAIFAAKTFPDVLPVIEILLMSDEIVTVKFDTDKLETTAVFANNAFDTIEVTFATPTVKVPKTFPTLAVKTPVFAEYT
ncbi:hypothetical protein PBCV1_a016L [Paramecium bursaria Chlorella virus 1]|uniref:Uncharacterized protein n=1 Tax=Paramecium bursaria Chlorella virus 1 TaxID=10506 RepID=Q89351_PBCV1|nr:hypothetical protein PBCV1_a016L [Paramecium bursaria Chlorella virus 1]AAC96384.1 hypothetical protein [Paramecium bursaria Chlorella virus 1]